MNETAFPTDYFYDQENNHEILPSKGMTLRDYFAAKAMQGIQARVNWEIQNVAELAYEQADAMLKAREQ